MESTIARMQNFWTRHTTEQTSTYAAPGKQPGNGDQDDSNPSETGEPKGWLDSEHRCTGPQIFRYIDRLRKYTAVENGIKRQVRVNGKHRDWWNKYARRSQSS